MNEKMKISAVRPGTSAGCGCGPTPSLSGSTCCGGPAPAPLALDNIRPASSAAEKASLPEPIRVTSTLSRGDRMGAVKARWGIGRMSYTVEPGLYALGNPNEQSEVLVTANYKLTFDALRSALSDQSFWILVLDTKGINVWCAAGKGTFGTEELVHRIEATDLASRVAHRRIVLPQLGAPGVAAHMVKEQSGFRVVYGPIEATDIPAFLKAGKRATPSMRRKRFPFRERAVLIPIELVQGTKVFAASAALFALLSGLVRPGPFWQNLAGSGLLSVGALAAALIAGAVLLPLLLPYLPGRTFSIKSLPLGLGAAAGVVAALGQTDTLSGLFESGAWLLIVPAIAAYLAMNFTGASTYTSLSGVRKEMKFWFPAQISTFASGLVLWTVSIFV